MKKNIKVISLILTILIGILSIYVINLVVDNYSKEITEPIEEIKQLPIENTSTVTEHPFIINLEGNMEHGDTLTISGTVPIGNSSITGMIYSGTKTDSDVTIVTVFQLTSDKDGFYTHNVVINNNYLWKQDVQYIISIQNNEIYKEIKGSIKTSL